MFALSVYHNNYSLNFGEIIMEVSTTTLYSDCKQIIESLRFKIGTHEAMRIFISHWCYLQTNMYKPSDDELEIAEKFKNEFSKLQHLIHHMAVVLGESDPLGILLTEYSSAQNNFDFFPTPACLSDLLGKLIGGSLNEVKQNDTVKISEICVGTGSIILNKIEQLYVENLERDIPLKGYEVYLEEINPLCCKALFLQILFKLEHLENLYGKSSEMRVLQILNVDVLSRKNYGINFLYTSPTLELNSLSAA